MTQIGERRRVEDAAARLSRGLLTLSRCNRVLWRARGEQELLQSICQILVETAGICLAGIGYCEDDAEKTVRLVAMAGESRDCLERLKVSWGNSDTLQRSLGDVIRTGKFRWINDIRTHPRFRHLRSEAIAPGYDSCVVLPLVADVGSQGHLDLRGALTLYGDAFDPSEIQQYADLASYLTCAVARLRSNLADDVTSGVTAVRAREDRRRAEHALRERAQLLDLTHDTIFVRDMNDVITFWNRGAAELYGWTSEQAAGKVSHQLTQTIFPEPLEEINAELLRTGRWNGELLHTKRDGTQVAVASRWALQRDEQGNPIAILETNNDITERKRAEEALRESEEQWKAVFENNPTMYFMVDTNGTIVSVNSFGAEQLGYRAEELIGCPVQKVFHEADREAVQRNAAICVERLGRATSRELRKIRKDGTVIWVRETARAMLIKERPVVLIACEDITEGKRAAEALREVQMELAHANRTATMGQLTASIAHEVNQPIAATVINAQAALRLLGCRPPDLQEVQLALTDIIKDSDRAADIIGRIRALVKKEPTQRDNFDINEAIREVIVLTRGEAVKNGVSMQTQLSDGLPLIQGDRVQLQQVILNLIINAVEAMSGDSKGSRDLLISTSRDASNSMLVCLRDSGPGLDPASLERLFDAFYTTKSSGMGMGLSICRSIIEAHGGSIWAAANEPRGAVFQFSLPLERDKIVSAE
jgi:PAS domain S-box-containing protein